MKIFILDDDPNISRLVEALLSSEGNQVECLPPDKDPLSRLHEQTPDLLLLDIRLGELSGLDILQRVRKDFEDLAVILISAEDQVDQVVQGLDLGANDYIRKPFAPQELLARVGASLREAELQKRLKVMIELDHVTDLFNMRAMYPRTEKLIASSKSGFLGLVMLDLDHFKKVNDENDHLFGTYVLSEIGALLKKEVEKYGIGARYGGDEFMLFLNTPTQQELVDFAQRLKDGIKSMVHTHKVTGKQKSVTASIGISFCEAGQKPHVKTLVAAADALLYECKNSGRDQFLVKPLS